MINVIITQGNWTQKGEGYSNWQGYKPELTQYVEASLKKNKKYIMKKINLYTFFKNQRKPTVNYWIVNDYHQKNHVCPNFVIFKLQKPWQRH